MVPGSTLRYGSHFWRVTRRPRLSSRQPMEAAATPFPREETTPPVTKIYFGAVRKVPRLPPGESAYKTLSWEMLRVSNCDFRLRNLFLASQPEATPRGRKKSH